MAVNVPRFAEDAHEDEFGGRVRIQATGDEEVRDGNAVSCLGPFYRERSEAGGSNHVIVVEVDVGDDGEDCVEGCGEDLESPCSLRTGNVSDCHVCIYNHTSRPRWKEKNQV